MDPDCRAVVLLTLTLTLTLTAAAAAEEVHRSGVVEAGLPTADRVADGAPEAVGTNVDVSLDPRPQNETSIAADPADPMNLVASANDYRYGDSDAGFAYSLDGGLTWVPDTLAGTNPLLGKYDAQGDGAVVAYRAGVFYYSFIDFARSDGRNRIGVAKSFDGGATWPQLGVVVDNPDMGPEPFEDKEYIAVDNTGGPNDGNVYVTWTRFPLDGGTQIYFSRSTDGGLTFSPALQISDFRTGYQGSVPVVGPQGQLYVAWLRNSRVEVDRSFDGGLSWSTDILVANITPLPSPLPGAQFRLNSFPSIAVDRSGGPRAGTVYVVWPDRLGVGDGPDVLLSRSTDQGQTWSPPVRVSKDAVGEYQWFPWVTVGPDGAVDVVFFDRRDDPGSTRYHTYLARSTNGGMTFGPNVRVSDQISDSLNDGFGGGFIGDYNGVTSTSLATLPFWTDVRAVNANAEGYTASLTSPRLTLTGSCPGAVQIEVAGASAGGRVAIFGGTTPGTLTLAGGPCQGIALGLADPQLLTVRRADAGGALVLPANLPGAACDRTLQVVDEGTCLVSGVVPVP